MTRRVSKLQEKIDSYCSYFSDVIISIRSVDKIYLSDVCRTTLYVCVLDALSKSIYPDEETHRKRFVKFAKAFCNWGMGDNVSLPHLVQLLKLAPAPEFNKLREFAYNEIANWFPGSPIYLENDPSLKKIKEHYHDVYENIWNKVSLKSLTHFELLYSYRNGLVHEFRRLGCKFEELVEDPKPEAYYIHFTDTRDILSPEEGWILIYPVEFLENMCEHTISRLNYHYLQNSIDPTLFYTSGNYFLKQLDF